MSAGFLIRFHTAEMIDTQVIPVALPKPETGEDLEKHGEPDAMEPASVMPRALEDPLN